MPPFDREGALKTAEKALRQGRIDAAIAEYVRIVEAQPRDWNSANALGDLYVRAKQTDKGVAQYTRIADHLHDEGFHQKAAALYKKILKINGDDEHALLQSAEIAAKQGLLADAKSYFKTVGERRRAKGDSRGAAGIAIRIGTLDPDDLDARLTAGRAAAEIGEIATALREYKEVGLKFEKLSQVPNALSAYRAAYDLDSGDTELRARLLSGYLELDDTASARAIATTSAELKQIAATLEAAGRHDEVLDVLAAVAERDPDDVEVRAALGQAHFAKGDFDRARTYLSPEAAASNPTLWLTLAELELTGGRVDAGRAAVTRTLALDANMREAALALGCRLSERLPDAGYACIDLLVDASVAAKDYAAAASILQEFTTRVKHHVIALMRLVDVCVDGNLEAPMYEAQAQLADAYLEVDRALEARIISEDLVAREPWNRSNIDRFRRALLMMGESDPDGIIAERLSGESPFLATDKMDLNEGETFDEASDGTAGESATGREVVADLNAAGGDGTTESGSGAPQKSMGRVFREMREDVGRSSQEEVAAEQYRLALTYRDLGMMNEAVTALEAAAKSPRQRFDACSLLGRLYVEAKNTPKAVEWFERAAEAPAPTQDASRALLYDLAETLEKTGEKARALAIFVELESEAGGYRDVARRIERLSKVQAKG
jgi:tetratricopeptide (TPR) repeat protein